jgi:hypothetical protein
MLRRQGPQPDLVPLQAHHPDAPACDPPLTRWARSRAYVAVPATGTGGGACLRNRIR